MVLDHVALPVCVPNRFESGERKVESRMSRDILRTAFRFPLSAFTEVAKGRVELPYRRAARRSERRVSTVSPLSQGVGCEGIEPLVATLLFKTTALQAAARDTTQF